MISFTDIQNGRYENSIAPFLWLHHEDDGLIVKELKAIHDAGIGAVCLESRTHDEFCRDGWWEDLAVIFKTCKELGMKVWILDDKHFPSGYANGIFKDRYPHLRQKPILQRHTDLYGPVRQGAVLVDLHKPRGEDTVVAVLAMRRTPDGNAFDGTIIDLSDSYVGGRVYFDLPEGLWTIAAIMTSEVEVSMAFDCDKLSNEATDAYIEEVYASHYAHFPEEFGKTLLGFFSDEPCFHNNRYQPGEALDFYAAYPWNQTVFEELSSRWGDKIYDKLLRLWHPFADGSTERLRADYFDVITALYRDNFSMRIGNWCEEHGVMYIGHIIEDNGRHKQTGCSAGHYFRALEGQHMSGVDVVLHQIMPGLTDVSSVGHVSYRQMDNVFFHYELAKLAASAAHSENRKQGRAMCEIFGAYGWAEDTAFMKYLADHFLVRGINYFVPHAFSPLAYDPDCPPVFYNGGNNPTYRYLHRLMTYMNRVAAFSKGALHVPTCAIVYDAEASYAAAPYTDDKVIAKTLYDAALDYDILPFDRLEKIDADGCLNGEYYPVILMPLAAYISKDNRQKLERLKDRVTVVGDFPIDGFPFVPLAELLSFMEPYRRLTLSENAHYIRHLQLDRGGKICLFLSNEDMTGTQTVTLRLKGFDGGLYTVYDPFDNIALTRESETGEISVTLAPYHLTVLLFGEKGEVSEEKHLTEFDGEESVLDLTWEIALCREKDYPAFTVWKRTDHLDSVTGKDALPAFSGMMRYTATLPDVLPSGGERVILDLGTVGDSAIVTVGGRNVGERLFPPYRFDITEALSYGRKLSVTVSNTSVFEAPDVFSRYMLLKPSGILGPVKLIVCR